MTIEETTAQTEVVPFLGVYDSLFETMSGLGGAKDRANQIGYRGRQKLTLQEIEDAINWDGVMETFVQRPAEDALANGVTFTKLKDAQLKRVTDWLEKTTKFWEKSEEAHIAMRRTGFGAIWLNTGAIDPELPLDPAELKNITSSKQLVVFDAECLTAAMEGYTQYDESPESWVITSPDTPPKIHGSRLIIFPGRAPSRRARYDNGGKGFPEPNIIWQAWLDWLTINHATPNIGIAFEEPTLGMEGLNRKMGTEEGQKQVRAKLADFAASRSVYRVNAIDSTEKYERVGPPVQGLGDIYDRGAEFLVAKSGWPFSIFFGKLQKSGLGGDGATNGEQQQWQRILAREWRKYLKPAAVQFLEYSKAVLGNLDLTFEPNPFQQHSDKEWAEIEEIRSRRDKNYLDHDVLGREEMREHLATEGVYVINPKALPEPDMSDPAQVAQAEQDARVAPPEDADA